ncbi:hypothetical protein NDU88_003593 [Pleurodeles waltl]|uniref:Uncharacterized protein n=1 Tax=Pleurodeles waltl TaxID=8319 RepID=A0AAV7W2V1_PLEWA|nr:hypothetical protein NDU88_003593 [Pleurodeles waltl]
MHTGNKSLKAAPPRVVRFVRLAAPPKIGAVTARPRLPLALRSLGRVRDVNHPAPTSQRQRATLSQIGSSLLSNVPILVMCVAAVFGSWLGRHPGTYQI